MQPTLFSHVRFLAVAAAALMFAVVVAGCGDDQASSTSGGAGSVTAPDANEPGSAGGPTAGGGSIRGGRYCEFLLITPTGAGLVAEVYATFPLNDCPAEVWDNVDITEVAASAGVPLAMPNGPRYWTIDAVTRTTTDDVVRRELGGLAMNRYATVEITDRASAEQRYTTQLVDRRAVMTIFEGTEMYVLVSPDGTEFAMQSYSQQVDAELTSSDLPTLGDRLNVPDGWKYEVRVLNADLVIDFGGEPARVLQDELLNSYSQIPANA